MSGVQSLTKNHNSTNKPQGCISTLAFMYGTHRTKNVVNVAKIELQNQNSMT
jgi:hypothetical protein